MFDNLHDQSGPGWTLHHAECVERMRAMSPDTVDAIVTDPPYHLTSIKARYGTNETRARNRSDGLARLASGFMGKTWDGGDVAFRVETWQAAWRVLKPGGYLMAFASSRGYHRMAVAIEDAGFITHPMIGWVYGCLDDQTECVTRDGVLPYHKLTEGMDILSYDATSGSYQWDNIEEIVTYDVEDTAYRISTDHGEQVVSRDHRCIVERGGSETFVRAQALEPTICVPILENLSDLLSAIQVRDVEAETQGDMFPEMRCSRTKTAQAPRESDGVLYGVSETDMAQSKASGTCQQTGLFSDVQRCVAGGNAQTSQSQRACGMDGGIRSIFSGENDRAEQSGLERRCDVSETQGELRFGEVRPMPVGISSDVTSGRVCHGTSSKGGSSYGANVDSDGSRTPSRPRREKQQHPEPDVVCDERGTQAIRAWAGHKTVVGRVTPFHYRGIVWCIRVRTGAFVAVRNGMAFPTGNSGFPKATNVSRMIDQALSAKGAQTDGASGKGSTTVTESGDGLNVNFEQRPAYIPATPEAAAWQGWYYGGQVRKPALEPICVAQKPFSEKNGALNILRWGVGAVNIDGCRVPGPKPATTRGAGGQNGRYGPIQAQGRIEDDDLGRWPANLMHDGSPEVLALFPTAPGQLARAKTIGTKTVNVYGDMEHQAHEPRNDSGSAARFFNTFYYHPKANAQDRLGSRHPTVKPMALMRSFVRHVCPPGGVVLDPFAGTGTTLRAAVLEDRRAIGIEADAASMIDTVWRMRHATQPE